MNDKAQILVAALQQIVRAEHCKRMVYPKGECPTCIAADALKEFCDPVPAERVEAPRPVDSGQSVK